MKKKKLIKLMKKWLRALQCDQIDQILPKYSHFDP